MSQFRLRRLRPRRLVVAVLLVAAAAAGPLAVPAPSATAAPATPVTITAPVQQYNVCGSACTDAQAAGAIGLAAWQFNAEGGWALSLNELCHAQFLQLMAFTGVQQGSFVQTKGVASGCDDPVDKSFGNGILYIGVPGQTFTATFPTNPATVNGPCSSPNIECRAMICQQVGTFAGPLAYCSTHIAAASGATLAERQEQANEYLFLSTLVVGDRTRFLMGDLNMEPTEVPGGFAANYNDLITAGTFTFNTLAGQALIHRLDYIWAIKPVNGTQDPLCLPDRSDHCWTHGHPTFTLGSPS